jgi:hypothetical protein
MKKRHSRRLLSGNLQHLPWLALPRALYRSQMKKTSFPPSLERESAALTVAGVAARYRSRIMSINLIKVEIAS